MAETTSLTIDCNETMQQGKHPNNLAIEYTLMFAKFCKLNKLGFENTRTEERRL